MMYFLHELPLQFPGEFWKVFNVFQYITFRAVAAAVTAFLLSLMCGNWVIRRLISLKLGQPIRTKEEVHKLYELHGSKAGTPTMGGVLLLGAVLISSLLWARLDNTAVWLLLLTLVYCGALGFWDDYLKVTKKSSAGVSEKTKLIGQAILAIAVANFFLLNPAIEVQARALYLPFYKDPVIANLGIFTFVFFALVIIGASNAVNLTDGLDGLAAGCTATAAFAYAVLAYVCGHVGIASYLGIPYYSFAGELTVVCMSLVGASFGFLWFNCHPAKVFMGDTGSLAIGGMLGVVAICTKQEMLLIVVGGVFVIEAMSVLIQRTWFKITKARYGEGRRIFLMSPVHHHFELKGWKENTVIVRFWILSIMLGFLGLATLKLR
ncbi:MAG TPA: phospho-N-acetylmuramoyl-pentapeptide-transferase [Chthoniobacteraceae bacterium]|jgi:phospho-N-acetylmuramoyl-pentapeptide-transferase|nr:rfe [Chthoniobacter sp.]HEV7869396.1 phospho-N-acetylmuramoyl-pentapeptide-transferase [Chthoniobacteraceae bacterium]